MPEGRRGKRKSGEPRTVCQHYRTQTFYDAAGRATLEECTDCGKQWKKSGGTGKVSV